MEVELFEIRNHLGLFRPFRELPPQVFDELVQHIKVAYFLAGSGHPLLTSPVNKLMRRKIVTATSSVSVGKAAAIMTRN